MASVKELGRRRWFKLAGAWFASAVMAAQPGMAVQAHSSSTVPTTEITAERLVRMSPAELDALYRSASPGTAPRGKVKGIPLVSPGKPLAPVLSRGARLVWQGKIFHDDGASATNRFFGLTIISGRVCQGNSWLDGRPSLILDYYQTSHIYGRYRDEIRQVAPCLYLGVMFERAQPSPTIKRYFAFTTAR